MSTKSNSSNASRKSSNASSSGDSEKTKATAGSNSLNDSESGPYARLCHLKKWPHFQGYGFNLHAERSKMGQHIGKVDLDSPADSAGLKEGDRIIEVNNVNISNENHQQVVKRIRNGLEVDGTVYPDQVILLVVDNKSDEYYKKINIVPKHDMKNIIRLVTPDAKKAVSESSSPSTSDKLSEEKINDTVASISPVTKPIETTPDAKSRRESSSSNSSDNSVKEMSTPKTINQTNLNSTNSSISRTSTDSNSKISENNLKENSNESTSSNQKISTTTNNNKDGRNFNSQKENSLPITPVSSNSSKQNTPSTQVKTVKSSDTPSSSSSSSKFDNNNSRLSNNSITNNNNNNKNTTASKNDPNDPYNALFNNDIEFACCSNNVDLLFKEKAFRAIHQILELDVTKTQANQTDSTTSITILNEYLNICRNFEANAQQISYNKNNYNRSSSITTRSESYQSSRKTDVNAGRRTLQQNSCDNSKKFRPPVSSATNSLYKNVNSLTKPPRPPPPNIPTINFKSINLNDEEPRENSLLFSKQSTSSSPIFNNYHQSQQQPSNLNFFFRHNHQINKNSKQFQQQNQFQRPSPIDKSLNKYLEMSAADYRNYLKSKGRSDPRMVQVDMKQKYEIFQNM